MKQRHKRFYQGKGIEEPIRLRDVPLRYWVLIIIWVLAAVAVN